MSELDTFIVDLALIMASAGIVTLIFKKFHLPVVLGYILAGFLISPNFTWLPTVVDSADISTWADIGIVFLMFGLGLEFSFARLGSVGHSAVVTALTVICCVIPIGYLIGQLLGWNPTDSIFLGCMISMSSTMVILKTYEEYEMKQEKAASLVLGALVIEDILGIFMIVILSTVAASKGVASGELAAELGMMMLYLAVWLVLGILLIPTFLRRTKKYMNDETLLIISVAICLVMVVIAALIGFSEALGAFMGGSILAGTVSAEKIEKLVTPLKDLFGAVFFVSVGMMIVPSMLLKYVVPIIIITCVTILGQMIFSITGMILSGEGLHTAVRGGMSMVQVGEFSFIIATMGAGLGVTGDFLFPIIVCVSVITIITTPVFVKSSERFYAFLKRHLPAKLLDFLSQNTCEETNVQEEESDWKIFLRRFAVRVLLTSASLFFVYSLGYRVVLPFAASKLGSEIAGIATALLTVICMLPIISMMWHDKSSLFKKLWLSRNYNRLPLTALRVLNMAIGVIFLAMVGSKMLDLPIYLLIPVAVVGVGLAARSEYLKSRSIRVEMNFVANFNERILHKRKKERGDEKTWLGDKLCVTEFGLTHAGMRTSVEELLSSRMMDALIIKIVRDGRHINMPGPDEEIRTGDVVTALGSRQKLDAFLLALKQDESIAEAEEDPVTLKEYVLEEVKSNVAAEDQIMCCVVPIDENVEFAGKTIRNSGFKENYGGFIIAVERDNLPVTEPGASMMLRKGDILWALGDQEMADKLIKDGLMHE